jgi:type II secretory pathway component GspD/PulD (secretin)
LYCAFYLTSSNVVERDNWGNELVEQTKIDTNLSIPLKEDKIIASWEKFDEVEQRIGVPFLMDLPVLKYILGTVTKNREKTHVYLVVNAKLLDGSKPCKINQGELFNLKLGKTK